MTRLLSLFRRRAPNPAPTLTTSPLACAGVVLAMMAAEDRTGHSAWASKPRSSWRAWLVCGLVVGGYALARWWAP